jgi:5-aminopentanamidase
MNHIDQDQWKRVRERLLAVVGDDIYNSAFFFTGEGARLVYRKSHLYGAYERELFQAETPCTAVVEHCGLKLGILICYDVEFPENVRRLALAGAQAVLVPTALPAGPHARFIARQIVSVRAFENQIFIAYANHCGADERFTYAGLSTIAAPDGSTIAAAGAAEETLLIAEIEPGNYTDSMEQNTYLADLRV